MPETLVDNIKCRNVAFRDTHPNPHLSTNNSNKTTLNIWGLKDDASLSTRAFNYYKHKDCSNFFVIFPWK